MAEQALKQSRKLKSDRKIKHDDMHMFRCPDDLVKLLRREENKSEAIVKALDATYARFLGVKGKVRCPACKGVGKLKVEPPGKNTEEMHHFRAGVELSKSLRDEENKSQFIVLALYAAYIRKRQVEGKACIVCKADGAIKP